MNCVELKLWEKNSLTDWIEAVSKQHGRYTNHELKINRGRRLIKIAKGNRIWSNPVAQNIKKIGNVMMIERIRSRCRALTLRENNVDGLTINRVPSCLLLSCARAPCGPHIISKSLTFVRFQTPEFSDDPKKYRCTR